ncbi:MULTISPECIES: hypothetical protein [Mammaliicoccus]|nr:MULTISPECIES: hypothetical protein [Mammaliicoccus]
MNAVLVDGSLCVDTDKAEEKRRVITKNKFEQSTLKVNFKEQKGVR